MPGVSNSSASVFVHVAGFRAYVGLVCFYTPAHLLKSSALASARRMRCNMNQAVFWVTPRER